jgi:hypothetical protein
MIKIGIESDEPEHDIKVLGSVSIVADFIADSKALQDLSACVSPTPHLTTYSIILGINIS